MDYLLRSKIIKDYLNYFTDTHWNSVITYTLEYGIYMLSNRFNINLLSPSDLAKIVSQLKYEKNNYHDNKQSILITNECLNLELPINNNCQTNNKYKNKLKENCLQDNKFKTINNNIDSKSENQLYKTMQNNSNFNLNNNNTERNQKATYSERVNYPSYYNFKTNENRNNNKDNLLNSSYLENKIKSIKDTTTNNNNNNNEQKDSNSFIHGKL